MTTRRQNVPTSQHNPIPEAVEPTVRRCWRAYRAETSHLGSRRSNWRSDSRGGLGYMVPDDASINYKHYLYGVPKKQA